MNKKRSAVLLATLFLIQAIALTQVSFAENSCILNVPARLSDLSFRQIYYILDTAIRIYQSDAIQRCTKEDIIERYGSGSFNSGVRFDLERIDMARKGWTRYYPVSVGAENFIVRIFLTEERPYQPKIQVLYEASVRNPDITIQVLPGLNSILRDCKIEPHAYSFYPASRATESSP